jgi:hypothetical protein
VDKIDAETKAEMIIFDKYTRAIVCPVTGVIISTMVAIIGAWFRFDGYIGVFYLCEIVAALLFFASLAMAAGLDEIVRYHFSYNLWKSEIMDRLKLQR